MTTSTEHLAQAARAGQDAVSTALRTWGETIQAVAALPSGRAATPRSDHLVDAWFEVASEALTVQRELTQLLISIGDPAVGAMTRAALRGVEATRQYTRAATEDTVPAAAAPTSRKQG